VASPLQQPATITLDLQFDISASQTLCSGDTPQTEKLVARGREQQGLRFLLGITTLGDAERYGLRPAALETHGGSTSSAQFTSASGRTFVGPSIASMLAAAKLMVPSKSTGTWQLPYSTLRKSSAGATAYPGTMLLSTDVPAQGLPKSTAANLATFLKFAATTGQVPGTGDGNLPAGFVPLTAANGFATMVRYTKSAAVDVAKQKGVVPDLTGRNPGGGSPTGSKKRPTPTATSSSASSPSISPGTGGPLPGISIPPTDAGTPPSVAGDKTSIPRTSTDSLGNAAAVRSLVSSLTFPLTLALAVGCAIAALALWRLDWPRSRR
jgi:hypothetical protein